ncbi:MAG: hypothetical protein E6017_05240 [Kluyvera cryocrescens]|nr:hypothetical protein [Kluyvera cryocrescens]
MNFRVVVHNRWWLKWYLTGLLITSTLTGLEPDPARVRYWVDRGTKIEVIPDE